MKAIRLHQPWASLIAEGIKTIETRSWAPPKALIGQRIAIHAAKRSIEYTRLRQPVYENLAGSIPQRMGGQDPLGAVVCTAVLSKAAMCSSLYVVNGDIVPMPVDPWGDFTIGRWMWFLEDIERLDPPVPVKGHQGFWNLEISSL